MFSTETKHTVKTVVIAALVFAFLLSLVKCNKLDDLAQQDLKPDTTATSIVIDNSPSNAMNPGRDPEFVNYDPNNDPQLLGPDNPNKPKGFTYAVQSVTWNRAMYIDKTDTIYNNSAASGRLAKYLKKYGFTGIYMYDTGNILGSSGNYNTFGNFLKQLADSGVLYRAVVKESATQFQSNGKITLFNNSQTNYKKKVNRANLEWEWWNGVTTFSSWLSVLQQQNAGTIADNDYYYGWYKNLGATIDTVAAKQQIQASDRILEHCYQNGYPTYGYANAQSVGATGGRLDIMAKGARQANEKCDFYIIISAEKKSNGAANDFSGGILQANNTKPNPYEYIEIQAYNNIVGSMTAFQKQWLNFKGFVWFDKRWCYAAVPPQN